MSDPTSSLPIQPDALGEDERHRPQPIDESPILLDSGDLIDMMRRTIDQLEKDSASRGDLKILNRTLRELRYAMKVFQPYRRRRKISIFGSARTRPDHPTYLAAQELGRAMASRGWMVITGAGGGIMEAGLRGPDATFDGTEYHAPLRADRQSRHRGRSQTGHMKYFFTRKLMFVKECAAWSAARRFRYLDEGA